MPWVLINDEKCPGCGRTGDEGSRVDDKCWRCNLPENLNPIEHGGLERTLQWERDNLRRRWEDMQRMSPNESIEAFNARLDEVKEKVRDMLERNHRDLAAIGVALTCDHCGDHATCHGAYEGGPLGYGCDECCGHGCEDGYCDRLEASEEAVAA